MHPLPDINNNLFEILKGLPREELEDIFRTRGMVYTKTEKKRDLNLIRKVYRELINLNKIKDFFYRVKHSGNLMDVIFYIFLNNGEVELSDIEYKYGKDASDKLNALERNGIIFKTDKDKVILPLEYSLIFADDYINRKHPVDKDTLIKGLYMYSNDEIKKVLTYINNTYGESFDTTNAKIYCNAMCYTFTIKNKQRLYDQLTQKQKEILNFVLKNDNYIKARKLVEKYPLREEEYHGGWYGYPSIRDVLNIYNRKEFEEKADIKKLFFIGFLVPIGDIYHSLEYVSIPREVYDIVAKEYIDEINSKRENISSKMLLSSPSNFFTCPDLYENLRKFLVAISSTHPKINKNGTVAKKSHSLITSITGLNEEEIEFFFVICSEMGWIFIKRDEYSQANVASINNAARKFLKKNKNAQKLRMVEKGIETTAWDEFHVKKNRYKSDRSRLNNSAKIVILSALKQYPGLWIDAELFLSYIKLDNDFKGIESEWNKAKDNEYVQEYYDYNLRQYVKRASRYGTLDDGIRDIYITLFRLGLLDIVTGDNENENTVTGIRLSEFGRLFLLNKKELISKSKLGNGKAKDRIIVQPNNEILISLDTNISTIVTLSRFTHPKKIDKFCIYELTKESIMRATSEGFDHEKIINFLEEYSHKEIPPTVISLIGDHSSRYGEIEIKECDGCMIFKDEILMNEILSSTIMKGLEYDTVDNGESIILIMDKSRIDAVHKRLQQKGYGVKR